jgi:16S rRNA (adenine1518-N6/adenine1519-N6)-dimethyltransferase
MVKAKKHLGQHFLINTNIAEDIVEAHFKLNQAKHVFEIGPGTGVLTKIIQKIPNVDFVALEIDRESIAYLKENHPEIKVENQDFLQKDFSKFEKDSVSVIGNFPYNISTQIVFKIIDNIEVINLMTGMFQKEVGERICAKEGSKTYGITSVITQVYFEVEYLFTVEAHEFNPPPKVKSGVIRITKRPAPLVAAEDMKAFKELVKMAFNQRRKTIRNSIKKYINEGLMPESHELYSLRPEQLNIEQFKTLLALKKQL